jgi:3-phenylpropionate/trans-cinnamate dioxygenase ferredoxin reductase subunit
MMTHYQYLVVGGGLAGDAAVKGIRQLDGQGSIGLISMESDPPYIRPYLSKALWKGRPLEKIWRKTQEQGVDMLLGRIVTSLDPGSKKLVDNLGEEYTYGKLLLAIGGSPNRLPFGGENIIYFRDLKDYHHLRALSERGNEFVVIGGGFIGSEIAAALTIVGKKVIMVFPDDAIGTRIYPPDLSNFLNDFYRRKGVEVLTGVSVSNVEKAGERYSVQTTDGRSFQVDGVVAGIGIRPNLDLARQAGLTVDNGIIADEHLQTSSPDIFTAGDVVNFYHTGLGKRVRVEHEDNAIKMGTTAGHNMAGANESYTHIPMFYSDLFELGYEAVGELNSKLEMVSDWQEPFKKGVIYYLDAGKVRGVLLWNVWDKVPAARDLLCDSRHYTAQGLKGKLMQPESQ